MLVTSRSFDEYVAMFALTDADLSGTVLDCSAGAADFAAVAAGGGGRVVAVDPAYRLSGAELAVLGRSDLERGSAIAGEYPDRFTWRWYGDDPERRSELRRRALARFLVDFGSRAGRYVAAQLPQLPFRAATFDLAVSSHLLFTWADQLGLEWHEAAIAELVRVAREVRLFPTVLQGPGGPVPFWDELVERLAGRGVTTELREVGYEFQVGARQMLVVTAGSSAGSGGGVPP